MGQSTREKIFSNYKKLKTVPIEIPEWEGTFFVSEMSGASRDVFEQAILEKNAKGQLVYARAKLVIATLVDENGDKIFRDEDVVEVSELSASVLDRICLVAQKVNKMTNEDLEELKKN